MACSTCESVPALERAAGTLHLAPRVPHLRGKLRDFLAQHGIRHVDSAEGVLGLLVPAGALDATLRTLAAHLSRAEQEATNAVFLPDGQTPGIADLLTAQPLRALVARVEAEWLVEMIGADRFEPHFQPIVRTAAPTEVYAHECLLRGRDAKGQLVFPGQLFGVARDANLLFPLDRAARIAAIRAAAAHGVRHAVFINFNPTTIYDPAFCLRTTVAAVETSGLQRAQFVFEVTESDLVQDVGQLRRILDFYRASGFRVALDDLGAGYSSLNLLAQLRPDFVKLDMELTRDADTDAYKQTVISKLVEMAHALGAQVVGEGVETRSEHALLQQIGVDLAQGYLFARPGSPPPVPR
jgi:EAL domain-containing protein (putative c-di-GMP-specific phosphodiesterase class I)